MIHVEDGQIGLDGDCGDVVFEVSNVLFGVIYMLDTATKVADSVFAEIVGATLEAIFEKSPSLGKRCTDKLTAEMNRIAKEHKESDKKEGAPR